MSLVETTKTMPVPQLANESTAIVHMIERLARDPSVDIGRIQQMIELREKLENKAAERAFYAALAEAQSEMGPVRKDAANPSTRSRYATLGAVINAIAPVYTRHGFGVTFDTLETSDPSTVIVEATVTCAGHIRHYRIPMPADGKGARGNDVMTRTHATGSAVSYGRRYLLLMIFNIATADDDGNAASAIDNTKAVAETSVPITMEQAQTLRARLNKLQIKDETIFAAYHISSLADIDAALLARINKRLESTENARKDVTTKP